MLLGKRIKLRAVEEDDLAKIVKWRNSAENYNFFYEFEPLSLIKQKTWFNQHLNDPAEKLFVISTLEGEAIGTVGFTHIDLRNRKAEWGRFLIGEKNFASGGIGAEVEFLILEYAFEHLNLNKLYCEVLASNPKVISLHKKFGFREDGILRKHIYKQGAYVDVIILSLLSDEYFDNKQKLSDIKERLLGVAL